MATWQVLATESYAAATTLVEARQWRSATSRAYYAVYARVASALEQVRVHMPVGREGPSHKKLPDLIVNHLAVLPAKARWKLFGLVSTLYALRVSADYFPSALVGDADARSAVAMMVNVFKQMKEPGNG